ncbi:hypothetical protein Y032_0075g954 [Ancylostoma ceylanicum]|nr:hypothetical protein Y032_0075g954 [Ancylostoma ceylanicum]
MGGRQTRGLRALLFANGSTPFRVVWHQGKEQDDDVVQLVNHEEDIASEEEEDYTSSIPVFPPTQAVFETKTTSLPAENVSEGLPAIELNLIE